MLNFILIDTFKEVNETTKVKVERQCILGEYVVCHPLDHVASRPKFSDDLNQEFVDFVYDNDHLLERVDGFDDKTILWGNEYIMSKFQRFLEYRGFTLSLMVDHDHSISVNNSM